MADSIIKVEHLSKSFVIAHEAKERYTSLRDVIAQQAKQMLGRRPRNTGTREEFWALNDVSFEIAQGDRVGIIGRNGAGKSTLLKILSRITEPTKGRIEINGRVASLLEVGTGFHPELTGRENIFLNGAILGMSRAEIRAKFDEIVAFAEVEKFLDTPVKRYSSGMYVRLAFAVAAHLEPEILVVDEVLAVGDAQFQKKCLGKMQDVSNQQGRTVLFVSHNMGLISQLCQKAILLKAGSLIQFDSTRNVIDNYVLNLKSDSNVYNASETTKEKKIFFEKIETKREGGDNAENFDFNESVYLRLVITCKEFDNTAKVSVTLQNNNADFLSTFVEDLEALCSRGSLTSEIEIKLPPSLIAPNTYALRLAIFCHNGLVHDLVEMVCPFRILETGSKMSLFEGINYGSFMMDYKIV